MQKELLFDALVTLYEDEQYYQTESFRLDIEIDPAEKTLISETLEKSVFAKNFTKEPLSDRQKKVFRVYSRHEVTKMSTQALGFLRYLEQKGFIDFDTREFIIEHIMVIPGFVELSDIKSLVLSILIDDFKKKRSLFYLKAMTLQDEDEIITH